MSNDEPEPVDQITMARWVGGICQIIGTIFAGLGVMGLVLLLADMGDGGRTATELVVSLGITWVGFLGTAAMATLLIGVGTLLRMVSSVLVEIRSNSNPSSPTQDLQRQLVLALAHLLGLNGHVAGAYWPVLGGDH